MELRDGPLVLRRWTAGDEDAVHAACQDPEIQRWMPLIPRPYRREHARAFVRGELPGAGDQFAVVVDGRVAGSIGMRVNEAGIGHIGYWTAPALRGAGWTTRALRLMCRYALEERGLARLELIADPDNVASQRVATNVGFSREGVLRSHMQHPDGRRRDSVIFSLLPGELA